MTGYVRVDTANNIADGNIIAADDLDNEFDGVQLAFNSSTGHSHDGSTGEGAPILAMGPSQDVLVGASSVTPKTTNVVNLGSSLLKFKDLYLAGNASIGGTLTVGSLTLSTDLPLTEGGTGASTASGARTNLGATTLGGNLFTVANVAAISFPQFNADNTISSLDASSFRTAIGAGTGTVTGVTATSPVASSGGTSPAISLNAAYGDTLNPYASKTANTFLAAPNGSSGVPTFRAIVATDVPTLNQNTTGSAGSVTNSLTVGTGLALSSGTTYNGSAALTLNAVGTTLNSQTSAYVLVASDAGKMVSITTGGVTVNNSVFSAGHIVTIYNNSGSSQTITQGAGVTMQWAGQASSITGTRTLSLYGIATIVFLSASSVVISGAGLS